MFLTLVIAGAVGVVSFALGIGAGAGGTLERVAKRGSFTWGGVGYRVESITEAEPVAVAEREINKAVTKYMRAGAYDAEIARINARNHERRG